MDSDEFFVAYKLKAGPGAPAEVAGNENKYFSGIWLQRKQGKYETHFTGQKCEDEFNPMDFSLMFSQNIEGY